LKKAVGLAEMYEDGNLRQRVGIRMDTLEFEMMEQATEDIPDREPKSPLEESFVNYDFIGIGNRNLSTLSQLPLVNGTRRGGGGVGH
jgi:hypothetical protein